MTAPTHDRRGFLRGLASLPLIGGGVALIGQPTATAVPVTDELLHVYDSFLAWERYRLNDERGLGDTEWWLPCNDPAYHWARPGWGKPLCPEPSTRAAVILSAAGVPIVEGRT